MDASDYKKTGLIHGRYQVLKADGRPTSPDAKYFVLRYDKDDEWGKACRSALDHLAEQIKGSYPQLARELHAEIARAEAAARG